MARKLTHYPAVFEKVTREAVKRMAAATPGGPPLYTIPCGNKSVAINIQMQLRSYWKSLRETSAGGFATPLADILPQVVNLACRYTPDRLGVEIINRNQMATAQVLAKALGALEESLASVDSQSFIPGEAEARAGTPDAMNAELAKAFGRDPSGG